MKVLAAAVALSLVPVVLAGSAGARSRATTPTPSLAPVPAGNGAQAFALDPQRPSVVYMAVAHALDGVFVYKTINGGRRWISTGAQGPGWVSDILSLTADPTHPGTWSEVFAGFGVDKVAVNPLRPSIIYGAGWAGRDPTHANEFRLLRSTDGGHTWMVAG